MLFDKVTIDDINKAVQDLNTKGIPEGFSTSKFYDVRIKGTLYPPKPIMAIANYYAIGKPVSNYFSGGTNTPCFEAFKKLGVEILTKTDNNIKLNFSETIIEFLKQAKTNSLTTKQYPKSYKQLKVKVSFGAGNQAKVPWIAFLKEPNRVTDGIYPVYLYFKNVEKLILAYGLSETNNPKATWNIKDPISIKDYFLDENLEKPDRYGDSYMFKIYEINNLPDENKMNEDLDNLLGYYKKKTNINHVSSESTSLHEHLSFQLSSLQKDCEASGLQYSTQLITRYIASLVTKPFVLLNGLSGSGKTKLAQAFAQWICENEKQYCIIPVGADWTNREPLLGYVNALDTKEYVLPENGALELIINANENPAKPYFLILDEMNLSHVERYFADFLSVMESNDTFKLHSSEENLNIEIEEDGKLKYANAIEVPNKIGWPKNLFVVGTVNIDETTYMFSPKVLDRANVIEFRVSPTDLNNYFKSDIPFDMSKLCIDKSDIGLGAGMGEDFVKIAIEKSTSNNKYLQDTLKLFFEQLQEVGAEFGYRTAGEIQTLFGQIDQINPEYKASEKEKEKIDIAIMQKLLPKLHGSRRKLAPVLETLGNLCITSSDVKTRFFESKETIKYKEDATILYPLSLEKIVRMYKSLLDNGFASYAEA